MESLILWVSCKVKVKPHLLYKRPEVFMISWTFQKLNLFFNYQLILLTSDLLYSDQMKYLENICSVLNTIELKVNWQNIQIILAKYIYFHWQNIHIFIGKKNTYFYWQNIQIILAKYTDYIGKMYRLYWQNIQIILAKCTDYIGKMHRLCWQIIHIFIGKIYIFLLAKYTDFYWQNTQFFIFLLSVNSPIFRYKINWKVVWHYWGVCTVPGSVLVQSG